MSPRRYLAAAKSSLKSRSAARKRGHFSAGERPVPKEGFNDSWDGGHYANSHGWLLGGCWAADGFHNSQCDGDTNSP